MRDQVTEFLTNYGKIDVIWFDFSYTAKAMPEFKPKKVDAVWRLQIKERMGKRKAY